MIHLNELRAIRDAYQRRAALALSRRFKANELFTWMDYLESLAKWPQHENRAGLELITESFNDYSEWAALTRFLWCCDQVWEAESKGICYATKAA